MTQRAILVVGTNAVSPDRAEEFHTWYDEVHIPQILERVPGFVGCRRYELDAAGPSTPEHRYLAIYEIEVDEPSVAVDALMAAVAEGRLDRTDSLDRSAPRALTLYRAR